MAEHTPTPWVAEPEYENGNPTYIHKDGQGIADCSMGYGVEDDANAAFIVKAVNAYDEMQEVLADLWLHFSTTDDPALRSIVNHARQLLPDPGTLSDVGVASK